MPTAPTVAKRSPEDHVDRRAGFDAPDLVPMNIKNEAEGRKLSQERPLEEGWGPARRGAQSSP